MASWLITLSGRKRIAGLISILTLLFSLQGLADGAVTYGGASIGEDDRIYFLGASVPFKGNTLGEGWVHKYWVDWLEYQYISDNQIIEADGPGLEAAIGHSWILGSWRSAASIGITYRYTSLAPDQPQSEARGAEWGMKVQLNGGRQLLQRLQGDVTAFYVVGPAFYWLSGQLLYPIKNGIAVGPDVAMFGSPDFRTSQLGLMLSGIKLNKKIRLGLTVARKKSAGIPVTTAYGVNFSQPF